MTTDVGGPRPTGPTTPATTATTATTSAASGPTQRTGRGSRPAARTVFVLPAAVALLAGLDAGLTLLGVWAPVPHRRLAEAHGLLMVLGFVGTLVALERAVALRAVPGTATSGIWSRVVGWWPFLGPVGLGIGALLQISPRGATYGGVLLLVGAVTLGAAYVPLWRRQRDPAVLVQGLGALCAVAAVVLWRAGLDLPEVVPWLACFVVLTIVGERLELARLTMSTRVVALLPPLAAAVVVAAAAALLFPLAGTALLGLALAAVFAWLATADVARHTIRAQGQARFMAVCLLAAQAWLAVAAGIWASRGQVVDGRAYDAVVHAVFLGFTLSMVMAHAAVILPAVTRLRIRYHPAMYGPVVLLHLSLILRIWVGDSLGVERAVRLGGTINALALLAFFAVVVWSLLRRHRPTPRTRAGGPR